MEKHKVTKPIKRLQSRVGPAKSKATVKNKHVKCALGQSVSFFQENIHVDVQT